VLKLIFNPDLFGIGMVTLALLLYGIDVGHRIRSAAGGGRRGILITAGVVGSALILVILHELLHYAVAVLLGYSPVIVIEPPVAKVVVKAPLTRTEVTLIALAPQILTAALVATGLALRRGVLKTVLIDLAVLNVLASVFDFAVVIYAWTT